MACRQEGYVFTSASKKITPTNGAFADRQAAPHRPRVGGGMTGRLQPTHVLARLTTNLASVGA